MDRIIFLGMGEREDKRDNKVSNQENFEVGESLELDLDLLMVALI